MADKWIPIGPSAFPLKLVDQGDGTFAYAIAAGVAAGAAVATGTTLLTYKATAAGVGYSIDDIITMTRVWDTVPGVPTVKATFWRNETLNTALAGPPPAASLALTAGGSGGGGGTVTFTNFRSSAVNTGGTVVRAAASKVHGWNLINDGPDPCFIKFYDSAAPTAAMTPIRVIALGGFHTIYESVNVQPQIVFAAALGVRITNNRADADAVNPTAPVFLELQYV